MKKYSILIASVVIPLVIFGVFMSATDIMKEDVDLLETDNIPVYVPSDITKANSNFVKMNGLSDLRSTIHVEDVAERVTYTIQGTVLSIDDPVDWNVSEKFPNSNQIMGFIPITISIENVYKGNLTDETFTFYIPTNKIKSQYHIYHDSANFEIDEAVLVHLGHYDDGPFSEGHYYPIISQYGKYQLQTVDSENNSISRNTNIDSIFAFNVLHPDGISLENIIGEAIP